MLRKSFGFAKRLLIERTNFPTMRTYILTVVFDTPNKINETKLIEGVKDKLEEEIPGVVKLVAIGLAQP